MNIKTIDLLDIKNIADITFPCVINLGPVYGIIDFPTPNGVQRINQSKNRLSGKYYGSISSLNKIPQQLKHLSLKFFENTFIRQKITSIDINNSLIKDGTHQTLFLDSSLNDFFSRCEDFINKNVKTKELTHPLIRSMICSSANISGSPSGSIISRDAAISFCQQQNIETIIENSNHKWNQSRGSFPIIEINQSSYKIHRFGPEIDQKIAYLNSIGLKQTV